MPVADPSLWYVGHPSHSARVNKGIILACSQNWVSLWHKAAPRCASNSRCNLQRCPCSNYLTPLPIVDRETHGTRQLVSASAVIRLHIIRLHCGLLGATAGCTNPAHGGFSSRCTSAHSVPSGLYPFRFPAIYSGARCAPVTRLKFGATKRSDASQICLCHHLGVFS